MTHFFSYRSSRSKKFFFFFFLLVTCFGSISFSKDIRTKTSEWERIGSSSSILSSALFERGQKSVEISRRLPLPVIPTDLINSPSEEYPSSSAEISVSTVPAYLAFPIEIINMYGMSEGKLLNQIFPGNTEFSVVYTGDSMPFKLKRSLYWTEYDNLGLDQRPIVLYPGFSFSTTVSSLNGIATTVINDWLHATQTGWKWSLTDGLASPMFGTSVLYTIEHSGYYLEQYSYTESHMVKHENTTSMTYTFYPTTESNTMRTFTYWDLNEFWRVVKNNPNQADDNQPYTADEIKSIILNDLKNKNPSVLICIRQQVPNDVAKLQCPKTITEISTAANLFLSQLHKGNQRWEDLGLDNIRTDTVFQKKPIILYNAVHTNDWKKTDITHN